jgi:hypothetical protein
MDFDCRTGIEFRSRGDRCEAGVHRFTHSGANGEERLFAPISHSFHEQVFALPWDENGYERNSIPSDRMPDIRA